MSAYASIRQHTSAYVSIRQHTSAYLKTATRRDTASRINASAYVSIRQHTSAYVSIRQHTSAYVSIPEDGNAPRHSIKNQRVTLRLQLALKHLHHTVDQPRKASAHMHRRPGSAGVSICAFCTSKATSKASKATSRTSHGAASTRRLRRCQYLYYWQSK
jgi:hypothetical protein